jgi:hypothetical protein
VVERVIGAVGRGRRVAAGATFRYRGASMVIVDGSGAKGLGPEALYLKPEQLQAAHLDVK